MWKKADGKNGNFNIERRRKITLSCGLFLWDEDYFAAGVACFEIADGFRDVGQGILAVDDGRDFAGGEQFLQDGEIGLAGFGDEEGDEPRTAQFRLQQRGERSSERAEHKVIGGASGGNINASRI